MKQRRLQLQDRAVNQEHTLVCTWGSRLVAHVGHTYASCLVRYYIQSLTPFSTTDTDVELKGDFNKRKKINANNELTLHTRQTGVYFIGERSQETASVVLQASHVYWLLHSVVHSVHITYEWKTPTHTAGNNVYPVLSSTILQMQRTLTIVSKCRYYCYLYFIFYIEFLHGRAEYKKIIRSSLLRPVVIM